MNPDRRVVDDRTFLLGLDDLYRKAMKRHERDELLLCARETAAALAVAPADVPVEGYYHEDERLSEYFRLVRALQTVPADRKREVTGLDGFQRLREVVESPLFGPPAGGDRDLLSVGEDPLSVALRDRFPDWTVGGLTEAAYSVAHDSDDCSLVALAALSRDPVVLGALRETVVLYAAVAYGCAEPIEEPEYEWIVDEAVRERAAAFVATFKELFGESLPEPVPENAPIFWNAGDPNAIVGRCVRVGVDDRTSPDWHYHWAIDVIETDGTWDLAVNDFWSEELWTTERYRESERPR